MHRTLRKLLDDARGVAEFVIAVNLDIRGFSSFCKRVESTDTAIFIKRVYMKLIDDYFSDASFFKPTGDGLLITIPYEEESLQDTVRKTIDSCFEALKDFGSFCAKDPMINFDVPMRLGIGLSRGSACRLVSRGKTLDYSGRVLNLASRLMDLARPTGIVFDAGFGIELLSDRQMKVFTKDSVYIRGIAESETLDIYHTIKITRISPLSKEALDKIKWNIVEDKKTLKQIKDFGPRFTYSLKTEPRDPQEIKVKIEHVGVVRGRKRKEILRVFDFSNFEYDLEAGRPTVILEYDALAKYLESYGVKDTWNIQIKIEYPER